MNNQVQVIYEVHLYIPNNFLELIHNVYRIYDSWNIQVQDPIQSIHLYNYSQVRLCLFLHKLNS